MEIPLAVGGNARLGLVEVIDRFSSDTCPGVVLRQRGQDLLVREIQEPEDDDQAGDVYLQVVEEMVDLIDSYLDTLPGSTRAPQIRLPYDPEPICLEALERITQRPEPGSETEALESEVAQYLEAEAVVALASTRDAYGLLAQALELGEGDEVICPGVASRSIVAALRSYGVTVRFADVEPGTLTLDAERAADAISDRTRALVIAHPFGQPAALDELYTLAADNGLEVVEDAGTSLGARFEKSRIGRSPCTSVLRMPFGHGDAGCDAVFLTLAPALAERMQAWAQSLRLSDGAAEIARRQLAVWDDRLAVQRQNARSYSAELVRYDAFRIPPTPEERLPVYTTYLLGLSRFARTTADDLHKLLVEAGIETRRLVLPACDRELIELPTSEQARASSVLLPVHPGIGAAQIDYALDTIFGYAIG
jgi:dTDP-4-amino-4,6-dideoxygalactose transaminase